MVRRLFEEHGAALVAYATRLTGDRVRAGDVVRETLVAAGHDPDALTGSRGAVRAHLFRLAATQAGVPSPASLRVLTALDSLPAQQREVLDALYFQGRDVAETAKSLGIPPETVKSGSDDALRALRSCLFDGAGR
nr:sigma factor-like helix-turn-helix DNA-binding protein [uncultured Actinoplanes sp.]